MQLDAGHLHDSISQSSTAHCSPRTSSTAASSSLPLCDPRRRPSMLWHRPSAIADAAVRSLRTRTGRRVSGGAGAGPVTERCPLFAAATPLSAAPMHASTRTQAHARTHMHTCAAAQAHPPRAGLGRPGACPPRHAYSRRSTYSARATPFRILVAAVCRVVEWERAQSTSDLRARHA